MIRKHINQPFAELLTHALITSRLDTCNSLLHGLKLVTLSRKFTHITPILKQQHWLPIEQRIIFKMPMFVFKTIHGASPTYLCSLVKPYEPLRGNIRSANKLLLTEHKSKNSWGARSFTVSAAKAWNTLPNKIRASATISVFKSALKTHLFKAHVK
ncbi:hypothetical protein NP493_2622g00003 [Ridgeia piscesae]|uniref:Uncharacterized protein n=1 Tax=Ridgeia piscesae TaxID=27915 RepID=A0AAD9JE33_RIDPI|nr:hypothetical protein NP493_2622g00003 [Ridgeia piscesae]